MINVDSELVHKLADKYPEDLLIAADTIYGQPTSDNGVPGSLYETIYAKGQRDALQAVRRAIDDVEIEKGAKVPRALKEAVRAKLETLRPIRNGAAEQ